MHPYILPHLMSGCAKHRIKRAAIFDQSRSAYATYTPAAGAAPARAFVSFWIKRHKLGARQGILEAGNATNADVIFWNGNDSFGLSLNGRALITNRLFRDPSAHHHVFIDMNGPSTRLVIDGVEQTSFATDERSLMAAAYKLGKGGELHRLAREQIAGSSYGDFTLSELYICIGALGLDEFDFGKTDPRSGSWMPVIYKGDVGINGGYWPMLGDAGDSPATAAEGLKDRAAITGAHVAANNWTHFNMMASDFIKDTPTNYRSGGDYRGNFAVLSPVDKRVGQGTLSNGNLQIAATTINRHRTRSTIPLPSAGKYIFSVELRAGASLLMAGMMRSDLSVSDASPNLGLRAGEVGYLGNGGEVFKDNVLQGTFSTITTVGHHVVFAVDMTGNRAWVGKWDGANVVWFGGGDPAAGTLPTIASLPTGTLFPCIAPDTGITLKAWFGAQGFPFALPARFLPLCVSALPKSSVTNPSVAFAQAVDSGANIIANLTAKRSGWGADYVEVAKSLSAEGWRWRFGFDPANHYDTSNAGAGRQAYPALGGASYWGCSLRIGAAYGTACGTVNHVNGAATPVADGLNKARKVVILFPRAGGNMPVYHPDAAAGELLYLNSQNGDAPATDITAVDASGFSVGAGMATGIYDWLVLAETSGLIGLLLYKANANADGPLGVGTAQAGLAIIKRRETNGFNWVTKSSLRNPGNPATSNLYINSNAAEDNTASKAVDIGANFIKPRGTDGDVNNTGGEYCCILIGAAAFATGECAAQATAR